MTCVLKAIGQLKEQQLTAVNEEEGREPSLGSVNRTDGTARSTGQLLGASLCHGDPGPSFQHHGYVVTWLVEL